MITDAALAAIAERLGLWIEHRDIDSLRDDDLRDLLAELRTMRRQHAHDVALITSCRQRYAALDGEYRDLAARYGVGDRRADLADRAGLAAEATEAQTAAEIGEAP
jgi:hypothetical protein